jgi:hypothetical protein
MINRFVRSGVPALAASLILSLLTWRSFAADSANHLSDQEKAEGWKLLFDGKSTDGWRSFKKADFPAKGWIIEDDCLKHVAGAGGGDIISKDTFSDFDLQFEWKIANGANSGVKYFITEERDSAIGHEYQIIDDDHHPDGKVGPHRTTGAFYDVLPPTGKKILGLPGEFNHSRIVVKGNHVEHWLNGQKVLEYELGSEKVKAAIAKSKFKDVKGFGTRIKGHILLQDHGDTIWFRNVKIKDLSENK